MKPLDLRDMTPDQLTDELVKLKREQFNLRFQAASGQLENTARVRQVRRDVARVKTILREQQSKEQVKQQAASEAVSGPAK